MTEPVIETLRLPSDLRDAILVHLIREAPNEGVGLLAVARREPAAEVVEFFPGENIDASPSRFTMHPRDVVAALDTIAARGWEPFAFQREVWDALRAIPYGTTTTYAAIARSIIPSARRGLVAKAVPGGTWAAASRAGSSVQALGR